MTRTTGWPLERGIYQVTRFCCTSGQCVSCHMRGNDGAISRRARVVQIDKLSQASAKHVARNWASYGAQVELMPPTEESL